MSVPSISKEVLDLTPCKIFFFDFIINLFLELEIGECSNQLIYIICQNLKHLTKLAFNGENITYSGVVGLVGQKDYLKSLSIKFEYSEMATKFEKQCPNFIWITKKCQKEWEIFLNLVAFSECMNFKKSKMPDKTFLETIGYAFNKTDIIEVWHYSCTVNHLLFAW